MKTFRFILAVFAFVAFTASMNAQPSSATLTKDGAMVVNSDQPLQSVYALDASNFNFTSDQDAIAYFAKSNTEYVSYRPVLQNNVIMVYLQIKARPDWTKSDWNAYFAENKIKGQLSGPTQQLTK